MRKVVLLDREGTIIVDPSYDRVDSPEKVKLLPNTLSAIKLLASHDYKIVIITNQTNIAQGRITEQGFWDINKLVLEKLKPSKIIVLKTYVCPHSVEESCLCRKPKPKMLLDAIAEFGLNPEETFMVGDRTSDIEAGKNAGTKTILVKTGKHKVTSDDATYSASSLLEAAHYIISDHRNSTNESHVPRS
jgi:D-glycero-D-manno-heptose 1,7-bisphosphate phosphatase